MQKKRQEEEEFKSKVMANPEWKKEYGSAWDTMTRASDNGNSRMKQRFYRSLDSQLGDGDAALEDFENYRSEEIAVGFELLVSVCTLRGAGMAGDEYSILRSSSNWLE